MKEPQPEEQASLSCTLSTVLIFDLDAFHILTADVQDAVYVRIKEGSGVVVGDGLHLALVQHQAGFDQGLAVTGGAGVDDSCGIRQQGSRSPGRRGWRFSRGFRCCCCRKSKAGFRPHRRGLPLWWWNRRRCRGSSFLHRWKSLSWTR